jgi:hypothetical protein
VSLSTQNHYVPQWYQRRFHSNDVDEHKVYYLDLKPDKVKRQNGGYYYRNAIRYLGIKKCFKQEHLYTLFFKGYPTDVIEKRFFGLIDDRGAKAVEFFSNYVLNSQSERFLSDLLRFMDAQKLRTPKGLDYLKAVSGKQTSQAVLAVMRSLWQMHVTIWMEGVWTYLPAPAPPRRLPKNSVAAGLSAISANMPSTPCKRGCLGLANQRRSVPLRAV